MDIKNIARWISEDMRPGESGLISESLYGIRVNPGEEPFDQFLAAVERSYIDFDPSDEKFNRLAKKVFGRVPNGAEWKELIANSSQVDELKQKLLTMVQSKPSGATGATGATGTGKLVVHTKSGRQIRADAVRKSNTGNYYYIGINPGINPKIMRNRNKRGNPEFFHGTDWKFEKILTMNRENILKIDKI